MLKSAGRKNSNGRGEDDNENYLVRKINLPEQKWKTVGTSYNLCCLLNESKTNESQNKSH